jgi:hypothetical protein
MNLGISWQAYYNLKLQLSTGRIRRDYLVLCHGFLSDRHYIRARVTWKAGIGGMESTRIQLTKTAILSTNCLSKKEHMIRYTIQIIRAYHLVI